MIRAAGQDGHRPIDLFGQHHPGHGVGPGLGAEGEGFVGGLEDARVQPVRPADDQDQPSRPAVAQGLDPAGEGAAGPGLAVLVAGYDVGVLEVGDQDFGLGGLAGFAGLDLEDLDRTQTQRPARSRRALGVVGGQGGRRVSPQPPDRQQGDLQLAALMWLESTDQIFSML